MKKLLSLACLLVAGCQTSPYAPHGSSAEDNGAPGSDRYSIQQDHAPQADRVRMQQLPQPTPKHEPLSRYGNGPTYRVWGVTYEVMESSEGYTEDGIASWYGAKFHGHRTSSGETYDMYQLSAAHKTLPLPTWARVTNLDNGKSTIVRVNDRGPFHPDRVIDLSWAAAVKLDIDQRGTGRVRVEALSTEPANQPQTVVAAASSPPPDASGVLFLQAGAFSQQDSAIKLVTDLNRRFSWPVTIHTRNDIYRVWIGPFTDEQERLAARQSLTDAGYPSPVNAVAP
ncbi:septal ring lytic transglycosylase RlpA family protein [Alcanivorax sp. 1008]|uniref:septal ring lytic transglycosylase RlpA family protein n=1 Tax=Alcanivorax sp. 1008 TaxID=2816853 RepID=UPI001DCEE70C|nr:septal ring lytic transglycosylase RlpA family protein [Alcanivorax sp. 1008]MCC1497480.1 septal ring lytic transglycosylase RlpA family protein [Alcanivorax sp. 1008]